MFNTIFVIIIMIIGTHNSITGYRPSNLLGKLFEWTCKCQDYTPIEQARLLGVRAFDFRIKLVNNKWILCHGLATYDKELVDILYELNTHFHRFGTIGYIRLGLESFLFKSSQEEVRKFFDCYNLCVSNYGNLTFTYYIKNPPEYNDYRFNFLHTKYIELQHSPQTLLEAIKGPRRLLPLQKKFLSNYDVVQYADFVH